MLTGLLGSEALGDATEPTTQPDLYQDVLPTMVGLTEYGTINLIEYAPMPEGFEGLLPPFTARVAGPDAPTDVAPELHDTASHLNWIEVFDRVQGVITESAEPVDDVILISENIGSFDVAAERGWITVWLNRDRVAKLSDVTPTAEIHSLLDLPEVLEAIDEGRAAVAEIQPKPQAPA